MTRASGRASRISALSSTPEGPPPTTRTCSAGAIFCWCSAKDFIASSVVVPLKRAGVGVVGAGGDDHHVVRESRPVGERTCRSAVSMVTTLPTTTRPWRSSRS